MYDGPIVLWFFREAAAYVNDYFTLFKSYKCGVMGFCELLSL